MLEPSLQRGLIPGYLIRGASVVVYRLGALSGQCGISPQISQISQISQMNSAAADAPSASICVICGYDQTLLTESGADISRNHFSFRAGCLPAVVPAHPQEAERGRDRQWAYRPQAARPLLEIPPQ